MSLTLPQYPEQDQIAESGGVYYQYTGSKWKRLDTQIYRSIVESTGYAEYSGNTVVLDTERYNYHKVTVESTGVTIDIPPTSPYDTFTVELSTPIDTNLWNIATASYDNSDLAAVADPRDIFFRHDGRKMYIMYTSSIYQYTLQTPWYLESAYYDNVSFVATGQDSSPHGIHFSPDGSKMYMSGAANNRVYQYSLSKPWDISAASISYTGKNISVAGQAGPPLAVFFKPDGMTMFIGGGNGIWQYPLTEAWNVSTASNTVTTLSVAAEETAVYGIFIRPDGKKLYIVGTASDRVRQYSLPNAWDLTGAFYDNVSLLTTWEATPCALFFKPDGTKMYLAGYTNDYVWQYSIGSYSSISVTWPSNVKWANGVAPTINQSSRYILEFTPVDSYFIGRVVDTFIEV